MHTKTEQKDVIESIKTEQMVPIYERKNTTFPYVFKRSHCSKTEQFSVPLCLQMEETFPSFKNGTTEFKSEQTFPRLKSGTLRHSLLYSNGTNVPFVQKRNNLVFPYVFKRNISTFPISQSGTFFPMFERGIIVPDALKRTNSTFPMS